MGADVTERADELWRSGNRGASLELLKQQLLAGREDANARRALVERYRELGAPDQAGRWGIALEGVTTTLERDRLARLLAASGVREDDVPGFLLLPTTAVTTAVSQVVQRAEEIRARTDAPLLERRTRPEPPSAVVTTLFVSWAGAGIASALASVVVWAGVVLGMSMVGVARWGALIPTVFLLLAFLSHAVIAGYEKRPGALAAWAAGALLLCSMVVAGLVSGITGGGVSIVPWER